MGQHSGNVTHNEGNAPPQKKLSKAVSFATAGLGGILGWIIIHPVNTLSVRMNLEAMSNPSAAKKRFPKFASDLIKAEGATGLYAGLGAGITRQIFYATSRFGLFEVFRDKIAEYREIDIWSRLLAGCTSGGAAAFISCPAEVSLVRMSNDKSLPMEQRRNYTSVFNCASRIAAEEGPAAFFRGAGPFVNRAMLVGATQVGLYDQFKSIFRGWGVTGAIPNTFCGAMTAGLVYSIITNPLETAKNRMAMQKKGKDGKLPYKGTIQTVQKIAADEGPKALWRGFPPYYLRCGGHTVMMFIFVELLRSQYRKITD